MADPSGNGDERRSSSARQPCLCRKAASASLQATITLHRSDGGSSARLCMQRNQKRAGSYGRRTTRSSSRSRSQKALRGSVRQSDRAVVCPRPLRARQPRLTNPLHVYSRTCVVRARPYRSDRLRGSRFQARPPWRSPPGRRTIAARELGLPLLVRSQAL
jgi:hypothetical protein